MADENYDGDMMAAIFDRRRELEESKLEKISPSITTTTNHTCRLDDTKP